MKKFLELLTHHASVINDITGALLQEHGAESFAEIRFWSHALIHQTQEIRRDFDSKTDLTVRLNRLAAQSEQFVNEMDFNFLLDKERKIEIHWLQHRK